MKATSVFSPASYTRLPVDSSNWNITFTKQQLASTSFFAIPNFTPIFQNITTQRPLEIKSVTEILRSTRNFFTSLANSISIIQGNRSESLNELDILEHGNLAGDEQPYENNMTAQAINSSVASIYGSKAFIGAALSPVVQIKSNSTLHEIKAKKLKNFDKITWNFEKDVRRKQSKTSAQRKFIEGVSLHLFTAIFHFIYIYFIY